MRSSRRLRRRLDRELLRSGLPTGPGDDRPVQASDLEGLPEPVRRYLGFMRVEGRPRTWSFRVRFSGRFRLRPGVPWMAAEAWQQNTGLGPARIYVMRLRFAGVLPMVGTDSYLDGRGRMLGKLLGVVTVADGSGEPLDVGELTTYLNDALLLAPTLLLGPATTWAAVDDDTIEVTLRDAGRSVTGRLLLDERGAPRDFSSTDRFVDLGAGPVRAEWRTPVHEWLDAEPHPLPGRVDAVWHLPDGPLPYVEGRFDPDTIARNVALPTQEHVLT